MAQKGNTDRYAMILERQKERLDDARRRKGENPTDRKNPGKLIQSHYNALTWISEKNPPEDTFLVDSSIIAPHYAPSTTSSDRLTKMYVKDLQLETHHRGFYLLLTTIVSPMKIAGVIVSLMRDEADDVVMTSHHYENIQSLYLAGVFMIKEPYFTITSDGDYCVRVDHVTDMIHICAGYNRVSSHLGPYSDEIPVTTVDWKCKGDTELKEQNYIAAAMA